MKRDIKYLEWRSALLERDKCCQICGKEGKYMNAHHLIPKNFIKWRYDMDNGIILCAGCHTLAKFSAHKNPLWFARWLRINKNPIYAECIRRLQELDET
jgi:hypothetical protein|tara:strand:+ start:57 stop:353 length:297 start_codon:yes stop_codon:yes gene_type:complete